MESTQKKELIGAAGGAGLGFLVGGPVGAAIGGILGFFAGKAYAQGEPAPNGWSTTEAFVYTDKKGRTWKRDLSSEPPPPAGQSDWMRPALPGAPSVRVTGTTFEEIGTALDNA